jgi:hypothetical protein
MEEEIKKLISLHNKYQLPVIVPLQVKLLLVQLQVQLLLLQLLLIVLPLDFNLPDKQQVPLFLFIYILNRLVCSIYHQ